MKKKTLCLVKEVRLIVLYTTGPHLYDILEKAKLRAQKKKDQWSPGVRGA